MINWTNHVISHAQFVNCQVGLQVSSTEVCVRNALFHNVLTNFNGSGSTGRIEQVTVNGANQFNYNNAFSSFYLTNCLLVAVANTNGWITADTVYVLASTNGIFQSVGAGAHYLAANSPYRGEIKQWGRVYTFDKWRFKSATNRRRTPSFSSAVHRPLQWPAPPQPTPPANPNRRSSFWAWPFSARLESRPRAESVSPNIKPPTNPCQKQAGTSMPTVDPVIPTTGHQNPQRPCRAPAPPPAGHLSNVDSRPHCFLCQMLILDPIVSR